MEQLRLEQLREACAVQTAALIAASEQLRGKRQEAAAPLIPKRELALAAQIALRQELEELRCLVNTEIPRRRVSAVKCGRRQFPDGGPISWQQ